MQALEKMSREQPLACLQAGAIMAVLGFIDFLSTSVQVSDCANVLLTNIRFSLLFDSFFLYVIAFLCEA